MKESERFTGGGWLNTGLILNQPENEIYIISSRGIGKTYGILKDCYLQGKKILHVRRLLTQCEIICKPELSEWRKINEKWYYFDSNCRMLTGWQKVDEKWYYLNSNGDMLDGWQLIGGRWYYLTPESGKSDDYPHGSMQTGFVDDGKHTYYCRPESENGAPEGSMVTGWMQLEEDWYYFNADKNCQPVGSMLRNHWIGKYYLKDDGRMAYGETLVIGGKEYAFGPDGKVE